MIDFRKGFPEYIHHFCALYRDHLFPMRWERMSGLIQEVTLKGREKKTLTWNVETNVCSALVLRSPCIWPKGELPLKKLETGKISLYVDYDGEKRKVALNRVPIKPFLSLKGPVKTHPLKWGALKGALLALPDGNPDSEAIGVVIPSGTAVVIEASGFDLKKPVKVNVGFLAAMYTTRA